LVQVSTLRHNHKLYDILFGAMEVGLLHPCTLEKRQMTGDRSCNRRS